MPSGRGPIMSKWQEEKAERNRQSSARLTKALPPIFPSAVLSRALNRPFVPPTPRLAIDSYWRAHPIRARPVRPDAASLVRPDSPRFQTDHMVAGWAMSIEQDVALGSSTAAPGIDPARQLDTS